MKRIDTAYIDAAHGTAAFALVVVVLGAYYLLWVPIEASFVPLCCALVFPDRKRRFIYLSAYLIPNAALAALGAFEIGVSIEDIVLFCGLGLTLSLLVGTYLGLFALAALYLIVGIFPTGPLSLVGYLQPISGLTAIILFCLMIALCERLDKLILRTAFVITCAIGIALCTFFYKNAKQQNAPTALVQTVALHQQDRPAKPPALVEIDTLLSRYSIVILGENVIHVTNARAVDFLCASVRRHSSSLYIGIEQEDGAGDMVHLSPDTCPYGQTVYQPKNIIPGVNGSWADINFTRHKSHRLADTNTFIQWLACYEAALPQRWLSMKSASAPVAQSDIVIVYTNTAWAKWFPADLIMRKVLNLHGKLTNTPVFEVNARKSALVVMQNV